MTSYPKASPCSNDVATPASSGKKENARTSNERAMQAHRKHQQTTTKQWPRVRFLSPLPKPSIRFYCGLRASSSSELSAAPDLNPFSVNFFIFPLSSLSFQGDIPPDCDVRYTWV